MTVVLAPVDAVDVTLVMDLSLDILMSGQDGVQRFKLAYDWSDHDSLLAEHGFSALVTVTVNGTRHAVLYDGGLSPLALQHNLDVMQVDVTNLRAITISHGHVDHHGGLEGLFRRHGALRLPLIIHPDAWKDRKVVMPTGAELHLPPPDHTHQQREGLNVIEEPGPPLHIDGTVLVSGQVARVTS
ncbi:MAG: MBL fold metallo-hydrolase, partial [Candidatus Dormibacteria bacterium]